MKKVLAAWFRMVAAISLMAAAGLSAPARGAEPPVAGPASLPVVRIEPAALTVAPGAIVTASIVIAQVVDLYGADVRLAFDPAVVTVVDANAGQGGTQLLPGPLLVNPGMNQIFLNQADNAAGTISYVAFLLSPTLPVSGTGVLAWVKFQGLITGTSDVTFTAIELATNGGGIIPNTVENGRITVGRPPRVWLPLLSR